MGVRQAAPGAAVAGVHGFAVALTSFVGRAGQLAEVEGLLGECRLVTVTGPGGVGKTRLAGEVARRVGRPVAGWGWLGGEAGGGGAGAGAGGGGGGGRWPCVWRGGAADRGAGWRAFAVVFGHLRALGRRGCRPVYGAVAGCR